MRELRQYIQRILVEAGEKQDLGKARQNLETLQQVEKLLDNSYLDLDVKERLVKPVKMFLKRQQRLVDQLSKESSKTAESQLAPEYKKRVQLVVRKLKASLVDPRALKVTYSKPWRDADVQATVSVPDARRPDARVTIEKEDRYGDPVDRMLGALKGWDGLKGETERVERRKQIQPKIKRALYDAKRWEEDNTKGFGSIELAYRSRNIPRDTQYHGHNDIERIAEQELAPLRKKIDQVLQPYKKDIKKVNLHTGEKGWVYVHVELV